MPPIGNADHGIVYAEVSLTLKRKKKPTRKSINIIKQTGST
jgi:hypothetical protein